MSNKIDTTASVIEWGVKARALDGQAPSGDAYVVTPTKRGVLVGVVDGLGHGERAARAAKVAVATLRDHADEHITRLFDLCHRELVKTRGAVMSLATFNITEQTMTWASVGNVQGVLMYAAQSRARRRESLMPRGGVVGYRMPDLRAVTISVTRDDLLIFSTDGIDDDMVNGVDLHRPARQIAEHIFANYHRGTDDALVLVARYKG